MVMAYGDGDGVWRWRLLNLKIILNFHQTCLCCLASTEIDHDDDDMKLIAASLTRAQANAVRRRIDSLNEAIRQRNLHDKLPLPGQNNQRRKDVRNIFSNTPARREPKFIPVNKTVNYVGQR